MKIGVAGTFIRDKIHPWQGEPMESIGGIFFTVSFLANLLESDDEIYPVSFVGEDFYLKLLDELSVYPNVRLDGLQKVPGKHTQVKLVYTSPQERYEITTEPMPELKYSELEILTNLDAVAVNLITGSDVELSALKTFRKNSDTLVYLDFHSHALGIDRAGKRYYQRPTDWLQWVDQVDVLQINEMEARTLAGYEKELPKDNLIQFGKEILDRTPQVCHITLAEQGSFLCYLKDHQKQFRKFNAIPVADVVDIIGCGDAFAAGYLVNYLSTNDVVKATQMAIQVSSVNCTFMGSSDVQKIRELLSQNEPVFT